MVEGGEDGVRRAVQHQGDGRVLRAVRRSAWASSGEGRLAEPCKDNFIGSCLCSLACGSLSFRLLSWCKAGVPVCRGMCCLTRVGE